MHWGKRKRSVITVTRYHIRKRLKRCNGLDKMSSRSKESSSKELGGQRATNVQDEEETPNGTRRKNGMRVSPSSENGLPAAPRLRKELERPSGKEHKAMENAKKRSVCPCLRRHDMNVNGAGKGTPGGKESFDSVTGQDALPLHRKDKVAKGIPGGKKSFDSVTQQDASAVHKKEHEKSPSKVSRGMGSSDSLVWWKDGIPVFPSSQKSDEGTPSMVSEDLTFGEQSSDTFTGWKDGIPVFPSDISVQESRTASKEPSDAEGKLHTLTEPRNEIYVSRVPSEERGKSVSKEVSVEEAPHMLEQTKISAPPIQHGKSRRKKRKKALPKEVLLLPERRAEIIIVPLHGDHKLVSSTTSSQQSAKVSGETSGELMDGMPESPSLEGREGYSSTESGKPWQDGIPKFPSLEGREGYPSTESEKQWRDGIPIFPSLEGREQHSSAESEKFWKDGIPAFPEDRTTLTEPSDIEKIVHSKANKDKSDGKEQEEAPGDSTAVLITEEISGGVLKNSTFKVEDTGKDCQMSILYALGGDSLSKGIKDQHNYAVYLIIVDVNADSDEQTEEHGDATESRNTLSTMDVEVLKWSEDGKPEIIQISPKPKPDAVPLIRVIDKETIIKGRRRMKVKVARYKPIDKSSQVSIKVEGERIEEEEVVEEEEEEERIEEEVNPPSRNISLGGIKDVTEDYLATARAMQDSEDEDASLSLEKWEYIPDAQRDSESQSIALSTVEGAFERASAALRPSIDIYLDDMDDQEARETEEPAQDTAHQLQDDRERGRKHPKLPHDTFHLPQDDGEETSKTAKPSHIETPQQLQDRKDSRLKDVLRDVEAALREGDAEEVLLKTKEPAKTVSEDEYMECEACPCGDCACTEKCAMHKTTAKEHAVETGKIRLRADDEDMVYEERNILQILSNAAVILEVHTYVKNAEEDTPGKIAVITVRPLMIGQLTQHKPKGGSKEEVAEAVLEPVLGKLIRFEVLLDEKCKLNEPISEVEERLLSELLRKDTDSIEIVKQWFASIPDVDETTESLAQGVLHMLPEILVFKEFCSTEDILPREDSVGSINRTSSYIVLIVSPAGSAEDLTDQQQLSEDQKEALLMVSALLEDHIVASALDKDLESSPIDATDQAEDQEKGTGDTHVADDTSESYGHKQIPKHPAVETGTVCLKSDDEEILQQGTNIFQVRSNAQILDVPASVTDNQDTPGNRTAISIRPVMVGKFTQKPTGSEEDVREAVHESANTRPVCIQGFLDENDKLQEQISEVEKILMHKDTSYKEIMKQWFTNNPDTDTSEAPSQGLLHKLREIVVTKGFGSVRDILQTDDSVRDSRGTSSCIVLFVNRAESADRPSQAGRVGQDVPAVDNPTISSTDMAAREDRHRVGYSVIEIVTSLLDKILGSSPIDATEETEDQKQESSQSMFNDAAVQTGTISLITDVEDMLLKSSQMFQVLSNAAIILNVHASIRDVEQDAPGKMVVLNIRPVMAGQLVQHECTENVEDVAEAELEPVSTRSLEFQVHLDENGKLQEPISEVEKNVRAELMNEESGSREIIEQWFASMPNINETFESLTEGLLHMLPEILFTKGLCSLVDILQGDDSVHSTKSESVDKNASIAIGSSSIILIVTPDLSGEATPHPKSATKTKSEEKGPNEQEPFDEEYLAFLDVIPSICVPIIEENHRLASSIIEDDIFPTIFDKYMESSPVDATDQTKDQTRYLEVTESTSQSLEIKSILKQREAQRGTICLMPDEGEAVPNRGVVFHVLSNAAIILDVHVSVTDGEEDTPGKTAVINFRPLMVGLLDEDNSTVNVENVEEAMLEPVNTTPVSFQLHLDENGKLQEPMSEVKRILTTELLSQDSEARVIVKQWFTSTPDINETFENLVQGLLHVLPEILVAKGICSMEHALQRDGSGISFSCEAAQRNVRFPTPSSSFIIALSPARSKEDASSQQEQYSATSKKSEKESAETHRFGQDVPNEDYSATHDDKHPVVPSTIGATDKTEDKSKRTGDTEGTTQSCTPPTCPKQADMQTPSIYLIDDDEEKVQGKTKMFQVLGNSAIMLNVHASITELEQDAHGKTALISISPVMAGQLTQHRRTGSEENMGEAVMEAVNTTSISFKVHLAENGKLREPVSAVERRLRAELLHKDTGIEQWLTSMPDINNTCESLVQELLHVLPEILVAKGFCSPEDILQTEDRSGSVDKTGSVSTLNSSIILIVSPTSSAEATPGGSATAIRPSAGEDRTMLGFIIEIVASIFGKIVGVTDQSRGTGDAHLPEDISQRDNGHYVDEEGDEYYDALDYVYTSSDRI